ncbi:hypothetical protein NLJ89_g1895 [Agrocybe chaxingu]|uniref:FAD-binding domain-containing protein n=1 Tax=Agrocybe chaxingu TaxID=84603 RepID=A0A9W8TDK0_9AGAR|nr:hypothetical protein NLJ89_g1895 [Agrocybe chaxingu]
MPTRGWIEDRMIVGDEILRAHQLRDEGTKDRRLGKSLTLRPLIAETSVNLLTVGRPHLPPNFIVFGLSLQTRVTAPFLMTNASKLKLKLKFSMSSPPILVVGSGPSGLVMALSLRKNGIPVRIIEKEPTPRLGERGAGVSPRSLELHEILGTFPDVISTGKPLMLTREYDPADGTKVVKTFSMVSTLEPTPQTPYINPIMLGQNHHERILREHLEKLGTKVEYGSELRSFKQFEDHVLADIVRQQDGTEIIEQVRTPWLIGMDGAHSAVRKALGLEFLGETREGDNIVIGDIKIKSGRREFWERWGNPRKEIVNLRPSSQDEDVVSFLLAGVNIDPQAVLASRDAVVEKIYEINGRRDIVFGDLIWSSRYRPNFRMVKQLRVGRVFIGGDTAHCHSPVGGQGLNSSIQDSFNLGWKLALVQKGLSPSSLLDTYAEERLPVIAEMLNKTTELFNQAFKTGGGSEVKRGGDMTQLGVNYRWSSIVFEENLEPAIEDEAPAYSKKSETAARAGDRAPEAPGLVDLSDNNVTSLFKVFSPSRHTVLIFSGADSEVPRSICDIIKHQPQNTVHPILILPKGATTGATVRHSGSFGQVLIDAEGHAYAGYHIRAPESEPEEGMTTVVVRPDGVIGARTRGASGVQRYFKRVFA